MPRRSDTIFGPESRQKRQRYTVERGSADIDWFGGSRRSIRRKQTGSKTTSLLSGRVFSVWLTIIVVCSSVLWGRAFYLQAVTDDDLRELAEGNRVRLRTIKAVRGHIDDRFGITLATNLPQFSVVVIPVDLPDEDDKKKKVLQYVATISNLSEEEVEKLISEQPAYSYQPVVISSDLTFDDAIRLTVESHGYPGVDIQIQSKRTYPLSGSTQSLSHVLGYLSKINQEEIAEKLSQGYVFDDVLGVTGLESSYEDVLRGVHGIEHVEVDAVGQTKNILALTDPQPGAHLGLSLDAEFQDAIEDILQRSLDTFEKKRGAVVALDPRNGEVLALVNLPAYDNNVFSKGLTEDDVSYLFQNEDKPLFNRAVSGTYPSGSTFKLVVGAAALAENVITPSTGFQSVGGVRVNRWFFPDWKAGGHGWTTITKAIAESVNTFFYIIGGGLDDFQGLGINRIKSYAEKFGFSRTTGIDIPGEASGFIPSPEWKEETKGERWYIGDTYNTSIGQGDILVTPLQIAHMTSIFANGGRSYQPHFVTSIESTDGTITPIDPVTVNEQVIPQRYIDIINQGLRDAVLYGSARRLTLLPFSSAAKTGTAQWSRKYDPHAWMTAYAPYQNPQIVLTVMIEEGEEGSGVASPIAQEILAWWGENRLEQ